MLILAARLHAAPEESEQGCSVSRGKYSDTGLQWREGRTFS